MRQAGGCCDHLRASCLSSPALSPPLGSGTVGPGYSMTQHDGRWVGLWRLWQTQPSPLGLLGCHLEPASMRTHEEAGSLGGIWPEKEDRGGGGTTVSHERRPR